MRRKCLREAALQSRRGRLRSRFELASGTPELELERKAKTHVPAWTEDHAERYLGTTPIFCPTKNRRKSLQRKEYTLQGSNLQPSVP